MNNKQKLSIRFNGVRDYSGYFLSLLIISSSHAQAQIVPDNTLSANSTVTPQGNVNLIQGGTTAGTNLFHSFQKFSLPTNQTAYFNNALNIQNIFTRVTGGSLSNIDGIIQANGTANLFLINPNGLIFGPNASLNIGGSFLASTASQINFADGSQFSATSPQTTPLLTVSVPIGLQFGDKLGSITVEGTGHNLQITSETITNVFNPSVFPIEIDLIDFSNRPVGLQVEANRTLALVGGEVILNGGNLTAFAGSLELGGVGSPGLVNLIPNDFGWTFDYSNINSFQDIRLTQAASATTRGDGAGPIHIQGQRVILTDGSLIDVSTLGTQASQNLTVRASEAVELTGMTPNQEIPSSLYSTVLPNAVGQGGTIIVEAPRLLVTGGGGIDVGTLGAGNSGNLVIQATEAVEVSGVAPSEGEDKPSFLSGGVQIGATGKGGDITIATRHLILSNGGQLGNGTAGEGDAGNIYVQASELTQIAGTTPEQDLSSSLFNLVYGVATGQGGDIIIETGRLQLTGSGVARTETIGPGNAGNLIIRATESVEVSGLSPRKFPSSLAANSRSLFAAVFEQGVIGNNAGNILIETPRLIVTDGGEINTRTFGQGNAGNITVKASELVEISGVTSSGFSSRLSTSVQVEEATGNSGDITIETPHLRVIQGGEIDSRTLGIGSAGNITVRSEIFELDGSTPQNSFPSSISTSASIDSIGNAGHIIIETDRLFVTDAARILTSTRGPGSAGSITIRATEAVEIAGYSDIYGPTRLSTSVEGEETTGKGGDITIETPRFRLTGGATVETGTAGIGDAGDLTLRVRDVVEISGTDPEDRAPSYLSAQTDGVGKGGNLTIETTRLQVTGGAGVSIGASEAGNGGNLTVLAKDRVEVVGTSSIKGIPTSIFAYVFGAGTGTGGNITIETPRLFVTEGAEINTGTFGFGNAGNLTVRASDFVQVSGTSSNGDVSSLVAAVEEGAAGKGGNLTVETPRLQVDNGARISAGDFSGFAGAGNIQINADTILLNNQALIEANTQAGNQGNITIKADSLQLRRNSRITTNAQGENVAGGNVFLNADVLAALENSDISANSDNFLGGTVTINTQGIFGTEFRETLTPQSDITATGADSSLSGTVTINTPDIDPTSGLMQLPENLVDATRLVASTCQTGKQQSQFTVTGRGGVPPNPYEMIADEATWMDLRGTETITSTSEIDTTPVTQKQPETLQLIEAQGWTLNPQGQVQLIAQMPVATPSNPNLSSQQSCP
jgi:filamentous hemagglutinin family protein